MKKFNGTYTIIDLDESGVNNRLKTAYEANNSIIIVKDNNPSYAVVKKDGTNFEVYLPDGTFYTVGEISGLVTKYNLTPRYSHLVTLSGTIDGATRTLTFEIESKSHTALTVATALGNIKAKGYDNATNKRVLLVADDVDGVASIYVTGDSAYKLHTKALSKSAYAENAENTLTITDTVKTLW